MYGPYDNERLVGRCLAGARRERLRENLGALTLRLAAAELRELDQVFAPGAAAGERYAAPALAWLDRSP